MVQTPLNDRRDVAAGLLTAAGLTADPWLALRLGQPAYHLDPNANPATIWEVLSGRFFVDSKIPVDGAGAAIRAFSEAGFRLIDTAIILERPISASDIWPNNGIKVRAAQASDIDAVADLARGSFNADRFHRDPEISKTTADEIKADWAAAYFSGDRGEEMLVADCDNAVSAFLLLLDRNDFRTIDLIAASKSKRRRGFAKAMIASAVGSGRNRKPLRVGTQLANLASLRLYQGLGFRVSEAAHVLHLHAASGVPQ